MPIYEFECTACAAVFERLQKLSDADPANCPECGKASVKRRLTAPSFRLAGSGWYETDFKKEGDKKRNLVAKDEAPKPDTASDSKSGSTSESKPESKPGSQRDSKPDSKSGGKSGSKEAAKGQTAAATAPPTPKSDVGK